MDQLTNFINKLETNYLVQLAITLVIIILFLASRWVIKKSLRRLAAKFSYDPNRTAATKRIIMGALYTFVILLLVIIWGGDLNNLWVSIGSILGVIAIGFFAIWSILSNIVAGIIIYTINPFKITDTLVLVEKEVTGKVIDIGLIYTKLQDKDGIFTVPNNVFFQQIVKVKKPK
ncbi:mechanosensitive ion channel family protein [Ekhidna sp.]|jgi:MscS family membrane protein|uniref:mechanosensitive ion channel family protein n=1 Tax=Ekhidna sp. TaxID=2608089 RepID=UPI0032EE2765